MICPNYDAVSESKKRININSSGLEMKATPVWSLIIEVAKEKCDCVFEMEEGDNHGRSIVKTISY